jgi:flagellar motor switch protein FliN/FliY
MSSKESSPPDGAGNAARLIGNWTEGLAQVIESMTDQRPTVNWAPIPAPPESARQGGLLWWAQPFQFAPEMTAWVAAPQAAWEHAGTLTLKAAGLETVEVGEARNTWLEILGQSLSVMARAIGAILGREVTCEAGAEHPPQDDTGEWASVSLAFPGGPAMPPILAGLSSKLAAAVAAPPTPDRSSGSGTAAEDSRSRGEPQGPDGHPQHSEIVEANQLATHSRTLGLLLDVDLPVSISFGKAHLPMKDVLKLTTGSIIELHRGVGDPVDVLVNHSLIARGEVVVVEGNYGVRIQEIVSRQDRLRSFR